ncbi:MAG TPA: LysM peptidoglycan-binding domain-containing protein, partial [Elusimicrobiales bacterium]|nr:LysM peptidoglycan-binding domain-containing protein [Elusimicrobiales bacterium]
SLETSIDTYRANKGVLESDLAMMQSRMRELGERLKDLQLQIIEAEHRKQEPRPVQRVKIPVQEKWPKLHKIAAGDTLRSLASQYYGAPTLWERIYDANQANISRGLPIEGSIFRIPAPPPEYK